MQIHRLNTTGDEHTVHLPEDQVGIRLNCGEHGFAGNEDSCAVMGARRFNALGEVHIVAHHGVIEAQFRTDVAHDGHPGVKSDTGAHLSDGPRPLIPFQDPALAKESLGFLQCE